jgi:RNase H-like domain found in reverse transcriptase
MTAPVLMIPDPRKAFVLTTDASGFAIGAVLQQEDAQGRLRPVAFESRKLNPAEQRYATHERETLAVIIALRQWRCYLLGKQVQVFTDHMSLKYLMIQSHLSSRQARWVEFLADYDLDIRYKAGKDNVVADALSRRPDHMVANGISFAKIIPDTGEKIKAAYTTDELIINPETRADKFSQKEGMWTYDGRLYIPDSPAIRQQILSEFRDTPMHGHMGVEENTSCHTELLLLATHDRVDQAVHQNMRILPTKQIQQPQKGWVTTVIGHSRLSNAELQHGLHRTTT